MAPRSGAFLAHRLRFEFPEEGAAPMLTLRALSSASLVVHLQVSLPSLLHPLFKRTFCSYLQSGL